MPPLQKLRGPVCSPAWRRFLLSHLLWVAASELGLAPWHVSTVIFTVPLNACQGFVQPHSHSYSLFPSTQWFTTGCPVSRGKCLSHHTRTPSPTVPDVKECPSYLQTHQELANSLSEERDETPQPRFCLIYNPFMTKKEPCIHKYRKMYKGSFFYPCSSDFWCSLWAEVNPGGDRWGGALCWLPICTCWLRKISFLKWLPEILTPQDSLVVATYKCNGPRHLRPPGHKTQSVQERGGKRSKIRGVAGEQLPSPQTNLDTTTDCKS